MGQSVLELDDIQGDVLQGLQKNIENFLFFRIVDATDFRILARRQFLKKIVDARQVQRREAAVERHRKLGGGFLGSFDAVNLGFTKDGLTRLLGAGRPRIDPAFERGADDPATIAALNDPPRSQWLAKFTADWIDGVFLVTGADAASVTLQSNELLRQLGASVHVVYAETGAVRPGAARGHEHFGFQDGISQPGIRGLTAISDPMRRPDEGLPGQDLIWPGEFVFGYPGQHPEDPVKPGPPPPMAASWLRNSSLMVLRRLEQKVPEFRRFVTERAVMLGMDRELLVARMVGRWRSGAPLELAPLRDDWRLAQDTKRNNDFHYRGDPEQRRCPYAAHIRKSNPRDDAPGGEAEARRHRIIRAGITFGPEVAPGEITTRSSRGLMFVCYQTSIERQFEWIQRQFSNNPEFVGDKRRPGGGAVAPGFDPIIGQAAGGGARRMDEPYPNYPAGNRRTRLDMPQQFVKLTAAAYFLMPSLSGLRTLLA